MGKSKKKSKSKKRSPSASASESEGEPQWVEKTEEKPDDSEKPSAAIKGPMLPPKDGDNWLMITETDTDPFSAFGRLFKKPNEEKKAVAASELEKTQKERELNPFWKNGGTGMPVEAAGPMPLKAQEAPIAKATAPVVGDGGLTWWTKALDRCKEMSKDSGKSLEEVAAERYGSLEFLMNKIKDAQELFGSKESSQKSQKGFIRPGQYQESGNRDRDRDRDRNRDRDRERDRYYSRSDDKGWRKKDSESTRRDKDRDNGRERDRDSRESKSSKSKRRTPSSSSSDSRSPSPRQETKTKSKRSPSPVKKAPSPPVVVQKAEERVEEMQSEPVRQRDEFEGLDANQLGAKIIKAQLMGDEDLENRLKKRLEFVQRNPKAVKVKQKDEQEVIIATKTDRFGNEVPVYKKHLESDDKRHQGGKQKKQKVNNYSKDGERERYFADDDKYDLKQLVEKEKNQTIEENCLMFEAMKSKNMKMSSNEFDDDVMADGIANKQLEGWSKIQMLADQKTKNEVLSKCEYCFDNAKKHLIIAMGSKSYLCVPDTKSLVEGHCFIVPMQHFISSLMVDEDVWTEMQNFRKALVKMFKSKNQDCLFSESFCNEKKFEHMTIECIPIDFETGGMAPMYFKKALIESESEWAQNKRIIDLKGKGVRRAVPKGLPFYAVDFGLDDGFAHIIENKDAFPRYFTREIVGGMLDLEPNLLRRPAKDSFSEQSKKALKFNKDWKSFDFTTKNE